MTGRSIVHRMTGFAIFAIALLIAFQSLGVFWHFLEDHVDGQTHHRPDDVIALHGPEADAPHHEADHGHVWMPPAASLVALRLGEPQPIAALRPQEDLPQPSATLFPPFAPPRA